MDLISWSMMFKLIFLIITTGAMLALIGAVSAFALFAATVMWHGMKTKKKSPEELIENYVDQEGAE